MLQPRQPMLFRNPSSAFLIALLATLILPVIAQAEEENSQGEISTEVVITEKARSQFRAGVAFMKDPDGARYGEAYGAFKAAYADSPSWKILGNLGIAAMKLERDGEAIEALETYLKEGGANIDESERTQVQSDLDTLKASVTWVTITTNVASASVIDERIPLAGESKHNRYEFLAEPLRLGLHAGRHKITVELEGYESATWSFNAEGENLSHDFQLLEKKLDQTPEVSEGKPVETHRPVPTSVWITAGSAGALGVGAVVTGILALGKASDYDTVNDGTDPSAAEDLRKSGKTLNVTTDVLIGAAVVTAGVSAYLYFTRPEVDVRLDSGFAVVPTVSSKGAGLTMLGHF